MIVVSSVIAKLKQERKVIGGLAAGLSLLVSLPVNAALLINKSYTPNVVNPGATTTLTLSIYNSNTAAAPGVGFKDILPTSGNGDEVVNSLVSQTCKDGNGNNVASVGSVTVSPNTQVVLAGETIPASNGSSSGFCTIQLLVNSPTPGTLINNIPVGTVTSTQDGTNSSAANATLLVNSYANLTGSKTASQAYLQGGGTVTYNITLNNSNLAPVSGIAYTDQLPANQMVVNPTLSNSCGGTITSSGGAGGTLKLSGGTLPASSSCTLTYTATTANTTTSQNSVASKNTIAANTLTTAAPSNVTVTSAMSATVTESSGGDLNKSFNPTSIYADNITTSTVTLNLVNYNLQAVSGASLTDALPANMLVAANPAITTSNCGTPSVIANAGSSTVSITNASIAAAAVGSGTSGVCSVTFKVVAAPNTANSNATNNITNTIPAGSYGSGLPSYPSASATLTSINPITVQKSFNPATVQSGNTSTVTITLSNADPTNAAAITNLIDPITASMGTGFVVASPNNAIDTCGSGLSSSFPASGSATVTVTSGSIPPASSCYLQFDITEPSSGVYGSHTNTLSKVVTSIGNATGSAGATALLNVQGQISAGKSFSPSTVPVGTPSTLTIVLSNNATTTATNVTFTDLLTTMDPSHVVIANTSAVTNTCGGTVTAIPGTTSFTLVGGSINPYNKLQLQLTPGYNTCTITLPVIGTKGVPLNTRTNTIPAGTVTATVAGSTVSNLTAITGNLTFTTPHMVSKVFSPNSVPQGGASTLTITLNNSSATIASTANFGDDLSTMGAGFTITGTPTSNCTGTLTVTAGATAVANTKINLTGGSIPATGNCTITVPIAVGATATVGNNVNTIATNGLDTSIGNNTATATATLKVTTGISIAKRFSPSSLNTNQAGTTTLTFTITNPSGGQTLTGLAVTDNLTTSMGAGHVVASTPNVVNSCGGAITAVPGAGSWSLSGGNLPTNTTCTVTLNVDLPAITTTATNTIPIGAVTNNQNVSNTAAASASITRFKAPDLLGFNKSFSPISINGGGVSTVTILFKNTATGAVTLTNTTLTDYFTVDGTSSGAANGIVLAANPNPVFASSSGTCTAGSYVATPGAARIMMNGATIGAGATCTLSFNVTSYKYGTLTNSILAGGVQSDQGASNPSKISASLTVNSNVGIEKYFTPNTLQLGNNSVLTLRIFNATNITQTGCTSVSGVCTTAYFFQDSLPAGITVAGAATGNTCGGTLTNNSGAALATGATSIRLVGGSLAASTYCDITIPVTGTTAGSYTNTIPVHALLTQDGATNQDATTDTLTIIAPPTIAKAFSPTSIGIGGTSTLTFTLTNKSTTALTSAAFTDTLTNMSIAKPGAAGGTCVGASSNVFSAGDTALSFSGLTIPAGLNKTCTVTVSITSSTQGAWNNTTSGVTSAQTPTASAVSNTAVLTVNALPTVSKAFGVTNLFTGVKTSLTFTLTNPNASVVTISSSGLTDTLPTSPGQMTIADSTTSTTCGGSPVITGATAGSTTISVSGGTIPANSSCTITINVTATTPGLYQNTSSVLATNEAGSSLAPAQASVTVIASPTIAKAFSPTIIGSNGNSTITFTLTNPNSNTVLPSGFTGAGFTDSLPANMTIAAPGGAAGGTCTGAATNLFTTGTSTLNFTGLTLPPSSFCTVTVVITSTAPGVWNNTASGVSSTQSPSPGAGSNTATLNVNAQPSVSKAFAVSTLVSGQKTKLTFTLTNPNATDLTVSNLGLTDKFPTAPGQMTLADTIPGGTCAGNILSDSTGAALAAGSTSVGFSGATIPANSSCTIIVNVTAVASGQYNNTSSRLTTTTAGTSVSPATANMTVIPGYPVSGYVYLDANNNGAFDSGETWSGPQVFVNLVQGGTVVQTTSVSAGAGAYSFAAVVSGSYTLVLSNSATGTSAIPPAGYNFVVPSNGQNALTMGTAPALNYNFGLLSGGSISGVVFRDVGPTANNGVQDSSGEVGQASVQVQLTNCANTVYATATTDGSGNYLLAVPASVTSGTTVCVVETNPVSYLSTGASVGSSALANGASTTVGATSYQYTRAAPATIKFIYAANSYTQLNFGLVPPNSFTTDNTQSALPGSIVYYAHQYTAGSTGVVTFTTAAAPTPVISGWQEVLYVDSSCTGIFQAGDPQITGPMSLSAGQHLCILDREFVPASAPYNAQDTVTVSASFSYTGSSPALTDVEKHTDITTVGQPTAAGLQLSKAVDQPTAVPGVVLTYTLTFTNNSTAPLNSIIINDSTPPYTTYVGTSAICLTPLPANLSACAVSTQPSSGGVGALQWTMTGTLAPGSSGQVSFKVTVAN